MWSPTGLLCSSRFFIFFFNDTATTEIYTLSLHDALPISRTTRWLGVEPASTVSRSARNRSTTGCSGGCTAPTRSEEHTSELQSLAYLVCRLLLEKKKRLREAHRTEAAGHARREPSRR